MSLPDVEQRIERAAARGLNALVVGERGGGKTTVVQQWLLRWREAGHEPPAVYVDGTPAGTVLDVIELLRGALGVAAHIGETLVQGLQGTIRPTTTGVRDARLLLARLQPLREVEPAVVILDGLVEGEIAHGLFGRLRDELWTLPLTWMVTADVAQRHQFLTPPADAFFEATIALRDLDTGEQKELLRRRLGEDWRRVARLVGPERGNPRRLLADAREAIVDERPIEELLQVTSARQTRAAQLGRPASMLLAELENLERPAAASDVELLKRLGVTRERATQILKRLEQHGLVESFLEPGERGRPRKLYRLRDVLADERSQTR